MAKTNPKTTEPKEKSSSVVKRMCSFPKGLYTFAQNEAKAIAKREGKARPNFSGYLAHLLFKEKFTETQTTEENTKA